MVINHLEKLFVTRDASTIINELEVEHPAAKLLVFAAQAQQQEIGDGTNFVRFSLCDLKLQDAPLPCRSVLAWQQQRSVEPDEALSRSSRR